MRNDKYEVKEHVVKERVLVSSTLTCDICGKQIVIGKGYWKAHYWHNDWGNDSCESHGYYDVCSPECLNKSVAEYSEYSSRSDNNTQSIEIEHTCWYVRQV